MTLRVRTAIFTLVQCLGLGAISTPAAAQAPPVPAPPDPALPPPPLVLPPLPPPPLAPPPPSTWTIPPEHLPGPILPAPPPLAPAPPFAPPGVVGPALPAGEPPLPEAVRPLPLRASRWQIDASLFGSVYSLHYPGADLDVHGNRASGSLSATRFLAPVVDDAAPRSLQPFLQRASALYASVGGYGFVTRPPFGGQNRADAGLGAGAGLDVHVTPVVAVTGGLRYGYDVLDDVSQSDKTHSFSASAGLGLRVDDVRFDVSYTFSASDTNGTFAPLRWGAVGLTFFAVLARKFTLNLQGNVNQEGGSGGVDLGLYVDKNLGLFLGGFGGRSRYLDGVAVIQYGGDAGLSAWITPAARLSAYYQLTVSDVPVQDTARGVLGYSEAQHGLSLGLALRF